MGATTTAYVVTIPRERGVDFFLQAKQKGTREEAIQSNTKPEAFLNFFNLKFE